MSLANSAIVPDGYQRDLRPPGVDEKGPVIIGFSMKMNSISEVNMDTMVRLYIAGILQCKRSQASAYNIYILLEKYRMSSAKVVLETDIGRNTITCISNKIYNKYAGLERCNHQHVLLNFITVGYISNELKIIMEGSKAFISK